MLIFAKMARQNLILGEGYFLTFLPSRLFLEPEGRAR